MNGQSSLRRRTDSDVFAHQFCHTKMRWMTTKKLPLTGVLLEPYICCLDSITIANTPLNAMQVSRVYCKNIEFMANRSNPRGYVSVQTDHRFLFGERSFDFTNLLLASFPIQTMLNKCLLFYDYSA